MKITFIGCGNMGEAMLSAILEKGLGTPEDITVSDTSEDRCEYIAQKFSVTTTLNNREAAARGELIILAIKPQNLNQVMAELFGLLQPNQLILSIVAGTNLNTLHMGLNHRRLVRAMPNTPAQIGEGITVWTDTPELIKEQREWASSVLGAMGQEIYVDDEKFLDMATAISGSGPAYFFLFVESIIEAAVKIGLSRDVARELVIATMLGSGHLIQKSDKTPAELRRMVTSPGGTTAEALLQFEKGGFSKLISQAVTAAYNKAKQLGS